MGTRVLSHDGKEHNGREIHIVEMKSTDAFPNSSSQSQGGNKLATLAEIAARSTRNESQTTPENEYIS